MKLTIIGTGYVGLVTGTCFSEMGNTVYCVDIIESKINDLKESIIPIYEPGLKEMVLDNQERGNLIFTTDLEYALNNSNIYFIGVGTPMAEDGSCDLTYVFNVAHSIGQFMNKDCSVVTKSTVPVGTGDKIREIINEELNKRHVNYKFNIISNPEFLKEGNAIDNCMRPDRIVIGSDEDIKNIMNELYAPFLGENENIIFMDLKSAEMTKYAANAMLATKISFINEMANICEKTGADINKVRIGIGSDSRIGYSFIYPGCGYGGSCFPKDVQALIKIGEQVDYKTEILKAVESVNKKQKLVIVDKVIKEFGEDLSDLTFGVWGLAFKPNTDDMREASSITIIQELTKRGAKIIAYDPKAIEEAKNIYLKDNFNVKYVNNKYDALKDVNAMILVTEWKEFLNPDFKEIKKLMINPVIFDGRNQYITETLDELGFKYYQIGFNR